MPGMKQNCTTSSISIFTEKKGVERSSFKETDINWKGQNSRPERKKRWRRYSPLKFVNIVNFILSLSHPHPLSPLKELFLKGGVQREGILKHTDFFGFWLFFSFKFLNVKKFCIQSLSRKTTKNKIKTHNTRRLNAPTREYYFSLS